MSETYFQNTETALKNQQASIHGLETQIGQLISEQPQGSLPSNTEPNPREHLNAISTPNKEGFITPELEIQQDNTMNKGREEELPRTKTTETVRYYHEENKDIHEERRLQIEELEEWPSMSSSRGMKITVPASKKRKGVSSSAGPIVEIRHPLLQFPRGPQEELFQIIQARPLGVGCDIDWAAVEQVQMADAIRALLTTDMWEMFFRIIEPTYLELIMELCSTFHLQTVMTTYDDLGTVQFCLGGLICQLSVPEFSGTLGLYTEEFREENKLHALSCHIHFCPSKCWHTLALSTASYNLTRSKSSVLPPSLSPYDSAPDRVASEAGLSIGPYVTRLARHFGLLNTMAQESSLTLIGQMSPQGISSMLSMRMIERRRGTYPS
ncbi:hypothetical protein GOBAR_AA14607 [Gossypium barbadense]|uniref:Uncharacterized protein n=1 Tax=Gossypium barbadense TaxID=3634 RepID=A0A2P5XRQ0_GOSBA|nr:hypothetical protein GOBAR_AA14607 [Gossypium barbadense]